jgi:hypothetical protein
MGQQKIINGASIEEKKRNADTCDVRYSNLDISSKSKVSSFNSPQNIAFKLFFRRMVDSTFGEFWRMRRDFLGDSFPPVARFAGSSLTRG